MFRVAQRRGQNFFNLVHAGSVRSGPGLSHCVLSGQGLAKSVWSGPYLIFGQLGLDLLYATQIHLTRTCLGSRTSSWVPADLDLELSVDFCSTPALAALMTIRFCSKKKRNVYLRYLCILRFLLFAFCVR